MIGLVYYKLVSPYPEDITKNCKLSVNEIDSNFFNLKGNDIEKAEFVREDKTLVLTRINGEKLFVDLSSATYDFNIEKSENPSGLTLTFTYDSAEGRKSVTLENVITADTLKQYMQSEIRVVSDDTLVGFGNSKSPLGVKRTEKTGFYAPADGIIDITTGGTLPCSAKLGTRYVTKEYINDYGYLYNQCAVRKISSMLEEDGRGWRVPSKADWDALLNSIEACGYKNHSSAKCHVDLGKCAGKFLKSECGWVGQVDCTCDGTAPITSSTIGSDDDCNGSLDGMFVDDNHNCTCGSQSPSDGSIPAEKCCTPIGVDRYGFRILPSGTATLDSYGRPQTSDFKEKAVFWTTTHVYGDVDQDLYVKEFYWNKATVTQAAECASNYFSVRLVKDYDGSNFFGSEYIDGVLYTTILHPESGQIWLASNYAGTSGLIGNDACTTVPDYVDVNAGEVIEKRKELFINEWNGKCWEKKLLKEGDTIVIKNPNINDGDEITTDVTWVDSNDVEHVVEVNVPKVSQNNVEFRVYTSEINCDKELRNTDDIAIERILHVIIPMLEAEREERIEGDVNLQNAIDNEATARELEDAKLWEAISGTSGGTEEIWEAISGLSEDISELNANLEEETERALAAEAELFEGISAETEARESEDARLWEAISGTSGGTEELWEALNQEIEERKDNDIDTEEEYVIKVSEGLTLKLKNGTPIEIAFDGNYGEF